MKKLQFALIAMGILIFSNFDCKAQTNPTNAYWDGVNIPMAEVEPGIFAIYSGDINQDGTIDAVDMNYIDNDASIFAFGYNPSDLSGDGATDALDMNYVDNSSQLFLFVARP